MSAERRRRAAPKQAPAASRAPGPFERRIKDEVTAGMKQRLGLAEAEQMPAAIQQLVDAAARDVAENTVEIAVIREVEDVADRMAHGWLGGGSHVPDQLASELRLLQGAEQLAARKKALEAAGFSPEDAMRILVAEISAGPP